MGCTQEKSSYKEEIVMVLWDTVRHVKSEIKAVIPIITIADNQLKIKSI